MKYLSIVLATVLTLTSLTASAEGAAGKWSTTVESQQGAMTMVYEFAVDGNTLTGSMSNDFMGSSPITEGTINGNDLAFKIKMESPNGAMTINYKGTVNGDEINMTRTFENPMPGVPAERTFTATRVE